ncbi:MAG: hypothetical protein WC988_04145 [Patescibacteria group bacterium]
MERSNNTPQEILTAIKSSKSILLIMDSRFDEDAKTIYDVVEKVWEIASQKE